MANRSNKRIGDILVDVGHISEEQLEEGLQRQEKTGERLGKAIVNLGYITEFDLLNVLSDQMAIPYLTLQNYSQDVDVVRQVPEPLARKHTIIPLFKIDDTLTIGISDPTDVVALDEIRRETGFEVEPVLCSEREIKNALNEIYGGESASMDQTMREYQESSIESEEGEVEDAESPIINIVNLIFTRAIKMRASDIHLNPEEEFLRVRFRVDGVLEEMWNQPKRFQEAIISRIKVMADMDIAERRKPQDGQFKMNVEGKPIDFRVSTLPTVYGENTVIRILDPEAIRTRLGELGMGRKAEEAYRRIVSTPYGIVFVTGPTGSGKTTTLYATLNKLNQVEKNIITIEDPVEYRLEMIRQSHMNPKTGMTFAAGLRSILRQDPDIIMVGEIRDYETASTAVQAALTGHLVLSTLHTNDTAGALTRLVDMGVEPFLVASATSGILAQRLVRKLCEHCKKPYEPDQEMLSDLGLQGVDRDLTFYHPVGCKRCRETGYSGRTGIFEVMELTEELQEMVQKSAGSEEIKRQSVKQGMIPLRHDGLRMVVRGITSVEEVLRVTRS